MKLWILITRTVSNFREFFSSRYHPELHYMRGPGPAFARRAVMVESRRVLPILRTPADSPLAKQWPRSFDQA
ncbi:hypothetical protein FJ930_23605 [Mesorhizobium sp. B2-4-15]|nr:hypothetical protein FJ930_23605 [Mesorhizobium sp. B2-4-15]